MPKYTYTNKHLAAAKKMAERIKSRVPYANIPRNFEAWAHELRLIEERDNIPFAEIGAVFRFANQHHFWYSQIRSPKNLRKHFAQIHCQMMESVNAANKQTNNQRQQITDHLSGQQRNDWANNIR